MMGNDPSLEDIVAFEVRGSVGVLNPDEDQ